MKRNQKGFTLIEIVAVLVVLGILAAVAIPKYFDMQDKADQSACLSAAGALNSEVTGAWAKNVISGGAVPYAGYTGDLGADFVVTGQAKDTPGTGTIKRASGSATYAITWTPGGDDGGPGRFVMADGG